MNTWEEKQKGYERQSVRFHQEKRHCWCGRDRSGWHCCDRDRGTEFMGHVGEFVMTGAGTAGLDVPTGRYDLDVQRVGYETVSETVDVTEDVAMGCRLEGGLQP